MVLRYMQYCLQKMLYVDLIESVANEGMFKFSVKISSIQISRTRFSFYFNTEARRQRGTEAGRCIKIALCASESL